MPRIIDTKLQGNHINTKTTTIEPPSKVKAMIPNIKLKKAMPCMRSFFEWNNCRIATQIPQIIAIEESGGSIAAGSGIKDNIPTDIMNRPNMKKAIFNSGFTPSL